MRQNARAGDAALLLGIVVIWGVNWPVMKIGLESVTPLWFAVIRTALAALAFAALLAPQGRLKWPSAQDRPVVLSVGTLQVAAYIALVTQGLLTVPAGRSAVLGYTMPLYVAPLAVLFLGERLSAGKVLGLALGLAGLVVLFNPLDFPWSDPAALSGNGYLLLAAFAWALAILHVRGHRWRATPLELAPWQMLLACLILLPLAILLEGAPRVPLNVETIAILIYNGILATAFCIWAAVSLAQHLPAVTLSLGLLVVPAAGLFASALILGEAIPWSLWLGGALVLAGMGVLNTRR